ncbi:MAG: hypothetical protein ACRBC3_04375 [Burkholderiaceae bacterium]
MWISLDNEVLLAILTIEQVPQNLAASNALAARAVVVLLVGFTPAYAVTVRLQAIPHVLAVSGFSI